MRLFFAIDLPSSLKLAIDNWRQRAFSIEQRPVPAENLHITLAFIGDQNHAKLERLEEVASQLAASSFELQLDDMGFFVKPRILWLGPARCPAELNALAGDLQSSLCSAGFALERRAFVPHITLWRRLEPTLASTPPLLPPKFNFAVDRFALFESRSSKGSVRYQKLDEWSLVPPPLT